MRVTQQATITSSIEARVRPRIDTEITVATGLKDSMNIDETDKHCLRIYPDSTSLPVVRNSEANAGELRCLPSCVHSHSNSLV